MKIRPLTEEERKYTYTQSSQIIGQTGCIGHLRGDFGRNGNEFFSSWDDHMKSKKTDSFKAELDDVINALRSSEYGLLMDRSAMRSYAAEFPESVMEGNYCTEYGFRAETEEHAFLIRCNPTQGDYNFYCYCYVKEWLDQHIENARKGIRFIDSHYNEKFHIADGEKIRMTNAMGETTERTCRYIDEYHTEVGRELYHICQFAEIMEQNGTVYEPVRSAPKQEEKENMEKSEASEKVESLVYHSEYGGETEVQLQVAQYRNNSTLYVGMICVSDEYPEPYGDVTVNLNMPMPDYCACVDTNNLSGIEDFLVKNEIAEFTGFSFPSGFCSYPVYMFHAEKLREHCPEGMAEYEKSIGATSRPKEQAMAR